MSKVTLKLIESNSEIISNINIGIADYVNKLFKKKANRIQRGIAKLVPAWVLEQPEIGSLTEEGTPGSLNSQFGFYSGTSAMIISAVTQAVKESTSVRIDPVDKNLNGGIFIEIQPENFGNLLSLSEGFIRTGQANLHWLDWLLTQGDRTIVANYLYQPASGKGRSGGGTMALGGSWRVPPQYSGRVDDNFITRALNGREKQILDVIESVIK